MPKGITGEGIVQTTKLLMEQCDENRSGMHNLKVVGSNPTPATSKVKAPVRAFLLVAGNVRTASHTCWI